MKCDEGLSNAVLLSSKINKTLSEFPSEISWERVIQLIQNFKLSHRVNYYSLGTTLNLLRHRGRSRDTTTVYECSCRLEFVDRVTNGVLNSTTHLLVQSVSVLGVSVINEVRKHDNTLPIPDILPPHVQQCLPRC